MVRSPRRLAALALAATALVLPACGGGSDDEEASKGPPPATPADFPKAEGKTLAQLREGLGPGPVLAPSVSVLTPGEKNRFGFGLFDRARKQIAEAAVAIYWAPANGGPARGPVLAKHESLGTEPAFESDSVRSDPDAAESVYVAEIPFEKKDEYEILGVAKLDDRLVATEQLVWPPTTESNVPEVGDDAPEISTPTVADVDGDIEQIETRVPPDTMHDVDYEDVLGEKPIMILFSTPALCQQRVCGPVNDVTEQVKSGHEDEAAWIHMEIFKDNELEKGLREQVTAFGLVTEPWLFAIDEDGKIAARLEGAFSVPEVERALEAATGAR